MKTLKCITILSLALIISGQAYGQEATIGADKEAVKNVMKS